MSGGTPSRLDPYGAVPHRSLLAVKGQMPRWMRRLWWKNERRYAEDARSLEQWARQGYQAWTREGDEVDTNNPYS